MDTRGIVGITPEIWNKLAESSAKGETLVARIAVPDITDQLVAAIDADGMRHLLVALRDGDADLIDRDSRGIDVNTRVLTIPEHRPAARYIDITCTDHAGFAVFDLFGGDIASNLSRTGVSTTDAIGRLIGKWRRFWGNHPLQLLTKEQQVGLFSELWFLLRWSIPKVGPEESMARWRGPFGSRHDFESKVESIEVKATTSVNGLIHRINGIDQLSDPDNGPLYLFSLKLREEASSDHSLPGLVNDCRKQFADAGDAAVHFDNALATAGYLDAHEPEYSKASYRVISELLFVVKDDFPRLSVDGFKLGIPPGVDKICYDIDLQVVPHLQVAGNAESYRNL